MDKDILDDICKYDTFFSHKPGCGLESLQYIKQKFHSKT